MEDGIIICHGTIHGIITVGIVHGTTTAGTALGTMTVSGTTHGTSTAGIMADGTTHTMAGGMPHITAVGTEDGTHTGITTGLVSRHTVPDTSESRIGIIITHLDTRLKSKRLTLLPTGLQR